MLSSVKLSVLLLSVGLLCAQRFDYSKYSIWEFSADANQARELRRLEQMDLEIDFLQHAPVGGGNATVLVSAGAEQPLLSYLTTLGVGARQAVRNVQQLLDKQQWTIDARKALFNDAHLAAFDFDNYHNTKEISDYLRSVASTCGSLCKVNTFGSSAQNRLMNYIRIGSQQTDNKVIFIESGVHAREWISPAVTLNLINTLITGYGNDPNVKKLVDTYQWYIIPVTNPDGYEYTINTNRFWRKTRRDLSSVVFQPCYGVDLNRNFDFQWGVAGASTRCGSEVYQGPSGFSEPETQNLRDLVRPLAAKTTAYISLHSYGQYWMLPYGYYPYTYTHNHQEMMRVANIGAAAIKAVNGLVFKVGTAADILYDASGNSFDWAASMNITYVYCLELRPRSFGLAGFDLDPDEIAPASKETIAGIFAAVAAMRP